MQALANQTISFNALQRARTTIEDFVESYFPYYGLSILQDFWKFWDVLVWVEATIYQLDNDNEAETGLALKPATPSGAASGEREAGLTVLKVGLRELGLLDADISAELDQGAAYWAGERRVCRALASAGHALHRPALLSPEDVLVTHEAKSFDYRVLHLLLIHLLARDKAKAAAEAPPQPVSAQCIPPQATTTNTTHTANTDMTNTGAINSASKSWSMASAAAAAAAVAAHASAAEGSSQHEREEHQLVETAEGTDSSPLLAFLRVDEYLVDIGDDLTDYEEDVVANSFNILRAYVHLYGRAAEAKLAERISALEAQHAVLLAALPPHMQQHYWARHVAAGQEGQGADRWTFPSPIYDEHAYRERVQQAEEELQAAADLAAGDAV